jgi:hypothetical protein
MLAVATACSDNFITTVPSDQRNRSVSVQLGEELDIVLGSVGPGFNDVPEVSSPALRFIDVDVIPPFNPGGPTQKFRFVAVERGTAIVTFHRFEPFQSVVQDTVEVR